MRRLVLLCGLIVAGVSAAMGQLRPSRQPKPPSPAIPATPPVLPIAAAQCRGVDLSVRHVTDDAAMGGERLIVYSLRNNSSMPCTLKGYRSEEHTSELSNT